jgi:hypothetical protein
MFFDDHSSHEIIFPNRGFEILIISKPPIFSGFDLPMDCNITVRAIIEF